MTCSNEFQIVLTKDRNWHRVTLPRGSRWPATINEHGRCSIVWEGHRIDLRDDEWDFTFEEVTRSEDFF